MHESQPAAITTTHCDNMNKKIIPFAYSDNLRSFSSFMIVLIINFCK